MMGDEMRRGEDEKSYGGRFSQVREPISKGARERRRDEEEKKRRR